MSATVPAAGARPGRAATLRLPAWTGEALMVLLYVAVATALQLDRQPGAHAWDSIWQEDGGIFLQQALAESFPHTLVHVYNSYLHVGPRLVAYVAASLPMRHAAQALSGGESLAVSLLSVYVYYAGAAVLRSRWARMAVAGSLILLPAAGYETNAVLSDMHWYLTYAAFWALVARPRGRAPVALAAVVVALAVLSDPFTAILLPLALAGGWRERARRGAWVVPAVFVLTLVIQLGFGLFANPAGRYAPSHWDDLPGIYGLRVAGSLFAGDSFLDNLYLGSPGFFFVYGAFAAVIAVVVYALRRPGAAAGFRSFVAQCFAYSLLYLAVPCMERGTANFLTRTTAGFNLNGSRYTVLPILFLVAIVVAVLDRPDPRVRSETWRRLTWAVGLWAAFLVLVNYSIPTTRTPGPSWKANLAQARAKCAGKLPVTRTAGMQGPARPGPLDSVQVFIAPNVVPPLWGVAARCDQIER